MEPIWAVAYCTPALFWPFLILIVARHSLIRGEALTSSSAYISSVLIGGIIGVLIPGVCSSNDLNFANSFITLGFTTLLIPVVAVVLKSLGNYPDPILLQPFAWILVIIETIINIRNIIT